MPKAAMETAKKSRPIVARADMRREPWGSRELAFIA
jgi:hypothetical protein